MTSAVGARSATECRVPTSVVPGVARRGAWRGRRNCSPTPQHSVTVSVRAAAGTGQLLHAIVSREDTPLAVREAADRLARALGEELDDAIRAR